MGPASHKQKFAAHLAPLIGLCMKSGTDLLHLANDF